MNTIEQTLGLDASSIFNPEADYSTRLTELAHRLLDGQQATIRDAALLMQVVGAYKYATAECRRLRDEAQAERLRQIRGTPRRQATAVQQQQGKPEVWFQAWADDFDNFLATPEGEAWLEQQADTSRDPYCV